MLRVFCGAHAICSPYNKVGRRQKRFYKAIRTTTARSSTTPHALECNPLVSPPGGLPGRHTGEPHNEELLAESLQRVQWEQEGLEHECDDA